MRFLLHIKVTSLAYHNTTVVPTNTSQIASPGGAHLGFEWASPYCPFLAQSGIGMGLVWSLQQELEWGPCGLAHSCPPSPMQIPHRAHMGFAWGKVGSMHDLTGLAHAHAIPTVPTVAHPSPTWDWTGLAIWDSKGYQWAQ